MIDKPMVIRKTFSVTFPCLIGWAFTYLAISVYRNYALGLFIWLPLVMGISSTLILGYKNPVSRFAHRRNIFLTLAIFFTGLLFFAYDGIICLLMAAPVGLLFMYLGYLIGYALLQTKFRNGTPTAIILIVLSVPALLALEGKMNPADTIRSVTTSIEINASPEKVWNCVVAFPQLKAPTELIFSTGIAFPINATIKGHGVGAIRHCNFSTGSFVEPITVWDEPRLLRFDVAGQPDPMKEISPYEIHPNHLHGYWISKQGQFKLIRLPNGHTLLEGTTWYVNKIRPDLYWSIWSDYIVHKIHERVLEHIKQQSEQ
jgi:Polyketide cyclase / dehydrase and lipid transport